MEEVNSQLVQEVKDVQRDPAIKEKWQQYCAIFGNNNRNPTTHNESFLSGFLQGLQNVQQSDDSQIFVGGLPHDATEDTLTQYFSNWGEVVSARMMHGKGFGFVTFRSPEQVTNVLQNREAHQINGKFIDCKKKQNNLQQNGQSQQVQNPMDPGVNNLMLQSPMLMQQPPNYGPARMQTRGTNVGPYQQMNIGGLNPLNPGGFMQKPRGPALDGVINSTEIFTGGLPADINEELLLQYFSQWGSVTKIDLKHGKGYAFISFSSPETVENICMQAGTHEINGKIIDCKKRVLDAHQQARATGNIQMVQQNQGMAAPNTLAKMPNPEAGALCCDKVFAGGLPRGTREEHLLEAFSAYGNVKKIDLKVEKGFAFIHFEDPNSLPNVLKQPIAIGDQMIECKQADSRASKMQVYSGLEGVSR